MQLCMQDIRRLGYLKIVSNFCDSYVQRIRQLNNDNYSIKCTPYGLPSRFNEIKDSLKDWYSGMFQFINYCEPMIQAIDLSGQSDELSSVKRKVRNKWMILWGDVEVCLGLSHQDCQILADFGIRLSFCVPSEVPEDILGFYNAILVWFINMQYENRLTTMGYSLDVILEKLTLTSSKEFMSFLLKEWC